MLTSSEKSWCWVTRQRDRLQDRWWCWKKEKKGQGTRTGDISPIVLGTWRMCREQFIEFTSNKTEFELIDPTLFPWLTRAFVERLTGCVVAREQSWVTMEQTSTTQGKITHYTGKEAAIPHWHGWGYNHPNVVIPLILQCYFQKEIGKKKTDKKRRGNSGRSSSHWVVWVNTFRSVYWICYAEQLFVNWGWHKEKRKVKRQITNDLLRAFLEHIFLVCTNCSSCLFHTEFQQFPINQRLDLFCKLLAQSVVSFFSRSCLHNCLHKLWLEAREQFRAFSPI